MKKSLVLLTLILTTLILSTPFKASAQPVVTIGPEELVEAFTNTLAASLMVEDGFLPPSYFDTKVDAEGREEKPATDFLNYEDASLKSLLEKFYDDRKVEEFKQFREYKRGKKGDVSLEQFRDSFTRLKATAKELLFGIINTHIVNTEFVNAANANVAPGKAARYQVPSPILTGEYLVSLVQSQKFKLRLSEATDTDIGAVSSGAAAKMVDLLTTSPERFFGTGVVELTYSVPGKQGKIVQIKVVGENTDSKSLSISFIDDSASPPKIEDVATNELTDLVRAVTENQRGTLGRLLLPTPEPLLKAMNDLSDALIKYANANDEKLGKAFLINFAADQPKHIKRIIIEAIRIAKNKKQAAEAEAIAKAAEEAKAAKKPSAGPKSSGPSEQEKRAGAVLLTSDAADPAATDAGQKPKPVNEAERTYDEQITTIRELIKAAVAFDSAHTDSSAETIREREAAGDRVTQAFLALCNYHEEKGRNTTANSAVGSVTREDAPDTAPTFVQIAAARALILFAQKEGVDAAVSTEARLIGQGVLKRAEANLVTGQQAAAPTTTEDAQRAAVAKQVEVIEKAKSELKRINATWFHRGRYEAQYALLYEYANLGNLPGEMGLRRLLEYISANPIDQRSYSPGAALDYEVTNPLKEKVLKEEAAKENQTAAKHLIELEKLAKRQAANVSARFNDFIDKIVKYINKIANLRQLDTGPDMRLNAEGITDLSNAIKSLEIAFITLGNDFGVKGLEKLKEYIEHYPVQEIRKIAQRAFVGVTNADRNQVFGAKYLATLKEAEKVGTEPTFKIGPEVTPALAAPSTNRPQTATTPVDPTITFKVTRVEPRVSASAPAAAPAAASAPAAPAAAAAPAKEASAIQIGPDALATPPAVEKPAAAVPTEAPEQAAVTLIADRESAESEAVARQVEIIDPLFREYLRIRDNTFFGRGLNNIRAKLFQAFIDLGNIEGKLGLRRLIEYRNRGGSTYHEDTVAYIANYALSEVTNNLKDNVLNEKFEGRAHEAQLEGIKYLNGLVEYANLLIGSIDELEKHPKWSNRDARLAHNINFLEEEIFIRRMAANYGDEGIAKLREFCLIHDLPTVSAIARRALLSVPRSPARDRVVEELSKMSFATSPTAPEAKGASPTASTLIEIVQALTENLTAGLRSLTNPPEEIQRDLTPAQETLAPLFPQSIVPDLIRQGEARLAAEAADAAAAADPAPASPAAPAATPKRTLVQRKSLSNLLDDIQTVFGIIDAFRRPRANSLPKSQGSLVPEVSHNDVTLLASLLIELRSNYGLDGEANYARILRERNDLLSSSQFTEALATQPDLGSKPTPQVNNGPTAAAPEPGVVITEILERAAGELSAVDREGTPKSKVKAGGSDRVDARTEEVRDKAGTTTPEAALDEKGKGKAGKEGEAKNGGGKAKGTK